MAHRAGAPPSYDDVWKGVYGDMQDVGPTHRHMRRLLRPILGGLDYERALEVGCGAGHNLPLLRAGRPGVSLAGIDISEEALTRARTREPDVELHRLDIQREQLEGTWDLVFSSLVLEHLPDDVPALERMRAMTGRWLVVTTIAGDFERYRGWEEQMGHVRNYARGELESKLRATGFEPVRAIYWGFPFYSPVARRLQRGARAQASYGLAARAAAAFLYRAFFLNSSTRGDLLLVVARAADGP